MMYASSKDVVIYVRMKQNLHRQKNKKKPNNSAAHWTPWNGTVKDNVMESKSRCSNDPIVLTNLLFI